MEPIQVMIEDLGRQVAQKAIESAEWKARAVVAEATLAEITEATEGDDIVLSLVPDEESGADAELESGDDAEEIDPT